MKILLSILIVLICSSLVIALPNDAKNNINFNYGSSTNYSTVNVNNSLYWQGHTGTDGSWFTGISTYNSSYVPYTGATSDVDLGNHYILTGTSSIGVSTGFKTGGVGGNGISIETHNTLGNLITSNSGNLHFIVPIGSYFDFDVYDIRGGGVSYMKRYSASPSGSDEPYSTNSVTLNTNLNADLLDGVHSDSFCFANGTNSSGVNCQTVSGNYWTTDTSQNGLTGTKNGSYSLTTTGDIVTPYLTDSLITPTYTVSSSGFYTSDNSLRSLYISPNSAFYIGIVKTGVGAQFSVGNSALDDYNIRTFGNNIIMNGTVAGNITGIGSLCNSTGLCFTLSELNATGSTNLTGYAQYQFTNNNFNGSGNFTTSGNINATGNDNYFGNVLINGNLSVTGPNNGRGNFNSINGTIKSTGTFAQGTRENQGAVVEMLWYPRKATFVAGRATGNEFNDTELGTYTAIFGQQNRIGGNNNFGAGYVNTISKLAGYSAVFGRSNIVNASDSLVAGNGINVLAWNGEINFEVFATGSSHVIEAPNVAVFGSGNTVGPNCDGSVLSGRGNTCTYSANVIGGQYNNVSGGYNFVTGYSNKVEGQYCTVSAGNVFVGGIGSVATGYNNNFDALTLGNQSSFVSGINSYDVGTVAMGYATTGNTLRAERTGSVAIGEDVNAVNNTNVMSFGRKFSASKKDSVNFGFGSLMYEFNNQSAIFYKPLNVSDTIITSNASSYTNQVVCYLAGGTLGHCTSVVGITGACTCVAN